MDNLVFKFDQATDLEQDQEVSKFSLLYKNSDRFIKKQQQRRNEILNNRLSKRDKLISSIRRLVSDVASEDEFENKINTLDQNDTRSQTQVMMQIIDEDPGLSSDSNQGERSLPCASITTNSMNQQHNANNLGTNNTTQRGLPHHKTTSKRVEDKFRNKAMLSEWLVDRPVDFESEWVLKATPVGRRCLVFAKKGGTVAYSRTGQFIKSFQSALPGGSRLHLYQTKRQFAIVDCIYVQHTETFYIMDALAWNDHKLFESEASFRFFWLQSRYNENEGKLVTVCEGRNDCRFFCLRTYQATNQDILTALNNEPIIKEHNLQLDGLLFFHSRGPYVPGANPLALWIKPDMVHRVLKLSN